MYKGKKLTAINQFSKGSNNKYKLTGNAKIIYTRNGKVLDRQYSKDFVLPKHECLNQIPFLNKFGLLDDDFCYINIMLGNRFEVKKLSYADPENIDTLKYKLNIDVSMKTGTTYSPFVNGKTLTQIILYISNNRLMALEGTLEDKEKTFHYKKSFKYDKEGRPISAITVDLIHNKTINSTSYSYSLW